MKDKFAGHCLEFNIYILHFYNNVQTKVDLNSE